MEPTAEVLAQIGDRPVADGRVEGVAELRARDEAEATQPPLDGEGPMKPGRADLAQLIGAVGLRLGTEEDTDRWAVEKGYVSMTPLRLLTNDQELAEARRRHPLG